MEQHDFTTPESVSSLHVTKIVLDWERQKIAIELRDEDGRMYRYRYAEADAVTLMQQLNKLDLSTLSLHKRILQRLATDGFIGVGSVIGSPD